LNNWEFKNKTKYTIANKLIGVVLPLHDAKLFSKELSSED